MFLNIKKLFVGISNSTIGLWYNLNMTERQPSPKIRENEIVGAVRKFVGGLIYRIDSWTYLNRVPDTVRFPYVTSDDLERVSGVLTKNSIKHHISQDMLSMGMEINLGGTRERSSINISKSPYNVSQTLEGRGHYFNAEIYSTHKNQRSKFYLSYHPDIAETERAAGRDIYLGLGRETISTTGEDKATLYIHHPKVGDIDFKEDITEERAYKYGIKVKRFINGASLIEAIVVIEGREYHLIMGKKPKKDFLPRLFNPRPQADFSDPKKMMQLLNV